MKSTEILKYKIKMCSVFGHRDTMKYMDIFWPTNTLEIYPKLIYNIIIDIQDTKHNKNLSTQNIWQNHWSKQNTKLREIKQNINFWRQLKISRKQK